MDFRHIFLAVVLSPVALLLLAVAAGFLTFKDHRVAEGRAYGFVIGETMEQTYARATDLQARGEIAEFRLGHGDLTPITPPFLMTALPG